MEDIFQILYSYVLCNFLSTQYILCTLTTIVYLISTYYSQGSAHPYVWKSYITTADAGAFSL